MKIDRLKTASKVLDEEEPMDEKEKLLMRTYGVVHDIAAAMLPQLAQLRELQKTLNTIAWQLSIIIAAVIAMLWRVW